MTKTIELTGDWDIPEGFLPRAEVRITEEGDYFVGGLYSKNQRIGRISDMNCGRYEPCLIPERKVIDWQKIIDNKVLCEFSDDDFQYYTPVYGFLVSEGSYYEIKTIKNSQSTFKFCRPAQNILFGHDGSECPLPDGVRVKVYYRGQDLRGAKYEEDASKFCWEHHWNHTDIVSYKILGLSEGYSYE